VTHDDATQQMLADLHGMWRIRLLEEKVRDLRVAGDIVGSVHLSIGQEAGPVGACTELRAEDALFATYRGHGWALARGVPPEAMLAELAGRSTGVNGGRGRLGVLQLTGARLPRRELHRRGGSAHRRRRCARRAVRRHRAAQRWQSSATGAQPGRRARGAEHGAAFTLPVVFVCENNFWSELTPIDEMVGEPELWRRAAGYGMAGERVDGNDPRRGTRSPPWRARARPRRGTVRRCSSHDRATRRALHRRRRAVPQARRARADHCRGADRAPRPGAHRSRRAAGRDRRGREQGASEIEAAATAALAAPMADPDTAKDHVYA
jgi:pyruvate dehydrogenase E1 component alpha subunit